MNGKMGSSWRKDPSSIMRGYGGWGDMTFTRSDGKKFVIPANIAKDNNKTNEIIERLRNKDSATEAEFQKAE